MAVTIGVVVTFLWATSVVLIRIGVSDEDIEPIGFAGTRFALAANPAAAPRAARIRAAPTWHGSRRWLSGVAIYGLLLFGLAQVGFYLALGQLEASTVGLFMGLAPVVTAAVVLRSRRERASLLQLGGIAVLIAGSSSTSGSKHPRAALRPDCSRPRPSRSWWVEPRSSVAVSRWIRAATEDRRA